MKAIVTFYKKHPILLLFGYCILHTMMGYILTRDHSLFNLEEITRELHQANAGAASIASVIGVSLGLIIVFLTPIFTVFYISFLYWVASSFLSLNYNYTKIVNAVIGSYIIIIMTEVLNFTLLLFFKRTLPTISDIFSVENIYLRSLIDDIGLAWLIMLLLIGSILEIKDKRKNLKQVLVTAILEVIFITAFQLVK